MADTFSIRRPERERVRRNAYAFEPVEEAPGLGLEEEVQQQQRRPPPPPPRPSRRNRNDWCRCGNCRPMPKDKECLCCHESEEFRAKMTDVTVNCISLNQSFNKICLDKEILEVVFASRKELLGESVNQEELINRNYRHISYRCFVWWVFNRLKKKDRRVIPSCAVWAIRTKFPEADGSYTGFMDAENGENEMDFLDVLE